MLNINDKNAPVAQYYTLSLRGRSRTPSPASPVESGGGEVPAADVASLAKAIEKNESKSKIAEKLKAVVKKLIRMQKAAKVIQRAARRRSSRNRSLKLRPRTPSPKSPAPSPEMDINIDIPDIPIDWGGAALFAARVTAAAAAAAVKQVVVAAGTSAVAVGTGIANLGEAFRDDMRRQKQDLIELQKKREAEEAEKAKHAIEVVINDAEHLPAGPNIVEKFSDFFENVTQKFTDLTANIKRSLEEYNAKIEADEAERDDQLQRARNKAEQDGQLQRPRNKARCYGPSCEDVMQPQPPLPPNLLRVSSPGTGTGTGKKLKTGNGGGGGGRGSTVKFVQKKRSPTPEDEDDEEYVGPPGGGGGGASSSVAPRLRQKTDKDALDRMLEMITFTGKMPSDADITATAQILGTSALTHLTTWLKSKKPKSKLSPFQRTPKGLAEYDEQVKRYNIYVELINPFLDSHSKIDRFYPSHMGGKINSNTRNKRRFNRHTRR